MAEVASPVVLPQELPLLRLTGQDRRALQWLKTWARFQITALKRRRKRLPPCPYSPEEVEAFTALLKLEEAAGQLLMEDEERQHDITQGV